MFKVEKHCGTEIMDRIFVRQNNADSRIQTRSSIRNGFVIPRVKTVHWGHDTLRYLGYKIWGLIPDQIKQVESVTEFKNAIKNWIPDSCPCRLCRDYIAGVGYVNYLI